MSAAGDFGNPLRKFKLVFLGEQSGECDSMAWFLTEVDITCVLQLNECLWCCWVIITSDSRELASCVVELRNITLLVQRQQANLANKPVFVCVTLNSLYCHSQLLDTFGNLHIVKPTLAVKSFTGLIFKGEGGSFHGQISNRDIKSSLLSTINCCEKLAKC